MYISTCKKRPAIGLGVVCCVVVGSLVCGAHVHSTTQLTCKLTTLALAFCVCFVSGLCFFSIKLKLSRQETRIAQCPLSSSIRIHRGNASALLSEPHYCGLLSSCRLRRSPRACQRKPRRQQAQRQLLRDENKNGKRQTKREEKREMASEHETG